MNKTQLRKQSLFIILVSTGQNNFCLKFWDKTLRWLYYAYCLIYNEQLCTLSIKRVHSYEEVEQINSCVSNLENELDKLDSRVKRLEDDRSKTTDTIMELEAGVTELNTQINELKTANEETKKECMEKCKLLEDKLLYAEVYARRENLRLYGIEEVGEQVAALEVFQPFLKRELKINSDEITEIEVQRVHRVGKPKEDGSPRPIIVRFLRFGDREFIFSKSKLLKGTSFGISADFPPEIPRRRKAQGKTLKDARKDGKLAYFSRVEPDKLYIDGCLIHFEQYFMHVLL